MAILKQIFGGLLLLALATVFFISGWSKLQTIEPFTWSFLDILPVSITFAGFIARMFIGLEWLIGALLLAHISLHKITFPATLALLLLLTIYLLLLIAQHGNTGNCGCFGEWLYMKPWAAVWKNVIMMGAVTLLWFMYPSRAYPRQWLVAIILVTAAFAVPFIMEPVHIYGGAKIVNRPINLDPIYDFGVPKPQEDLRKGKHILCFFSTTCPHCKKGAYLVQILHRRHPGLPVFMVLNGTDSLQKEFLEETKSAGVPHTLMGNTSAFSSMAGSFVPAIYWTKDATIERESYYTELEPGTIRAWLGQ